MIKSFRNKETEKVYTREGSSKLPRDIQQAALRKLRMSQGLEAALEGVGGPGGLEQPQQFALGGKQNVVALADGAVAEGLGDMALPVPVGPAISTATFSSR